jgi:hypothetical protein
MESSLEAESTEIDTSILSQGEVDIEQSVKRGVGQEDEGFMGNYLSCDLFGDVGGLIMSPGEILHLAGEIQIEDFNIGS